MGYVNVDIDLTGHMLGVRVKFLLDTVIHCALNFSGEAEVQSFEKVTYEEGLQQIVRKIVTTIDIDGYQLQQEEYEYVGTRSVEDFASAKELKQMSVEYLNDYLIPNNTITSTPFVNDIKYLEVLDIMINE